MERQMHTNRRKLLVASIALAALGFAGGVSAQNFPQKPVTLVVGFPPGGNIDIVARSLSKPLSKILGQPVVVDYKAGAGGSIGAAYVARSEPDGYTLLIGIPEQITMLPHMIKTTYKLNDFQPVSLASRTSLIMVARKADDRFKSFKDVTDYAKAKPGELNAGHAGPGTTNHLGILQFEDATKLKLNAIAFKGAAPAIVSLIGGQVDVVFDQVTTSMPHIKSGSIQPLAIVGQQEDPALPGVPTMKQLGLNEIDATTYVGVMAPAATPSAVIAQLTKAIQEALKDPQMINTLKELGSNVYAGDLDEFRKLLKNGDALASTMVKDGRVRTE
jgi:tripartite-type tricarboxylate transporter receptor subunit TctC